jgi:hypothetical protein
MEKQQRRKTMDWKDILSFLFKFNEYNLAIAYLLTYVSFYFDKVTIKTHPYMNDFFALCFSVFASICFWLLIQKVISLIISFFRKMINESKKRKAREKIEKDKADKLAEAADLRLKEELFSLWDWMDNLTNDAHGVVVGLFLEGNKPLQLFKTNDEYSILNSSRLQCFPCRDKEKVIAFLSKQSSYCQDQTVYDYNLNEDIFRFMVASYSSYGKISGRDSESEILKEYEESLQKMYGSVKV